MAQTMEDEPEGFQAQAAVAGHVRYSRRERRRQRDGVGSNANFHSYQHETAVRRERGPFK